MQYREATTFDAAVLARMNVQLIQDEGHRNRMSPDELVARMSAWLAGEYRAVLFEDDHGPAGYALFRVDDEFIYLRQFFVCPKRRRRGIGRAAVRWLIENVWRGRPQTRLEVLVSNHAGIDFWHAVGFADYCITMERPLETSIAGDSTAAGQPL